MIFRSKSFLFQENSCIFVADLFDLFDRRNNG